MGLRITVGGAEWTYTYNIDGIRTGKSKVNNSGTYTEEYVIVGGKIVAAKQNNGTYVYFYYDGSGSLLAMEYGGNMYYYLHNIQGDVAGLIDSNY